MNLLHAALDYIRANSSEFTGEVQTHLQLSGYALLIAAAICIPLGVLASRSRYVSLYALNVFGAARAIPSIAILFITYPYVQGELTVGVLALTVLACPPIIVNTNVAFRGVEPAIREAAYGMGMNTVQVLLRVELPLALPVVIAGLRTAALEVIASATLATFIGAQGLGDYIVRGLQSQDQQYLLLVGAIPVALLAVAAELTLGSLEYLTRRLTGVQARTA